MVVLDRVTSDTTLTDTAAETTMYTFSVPANMGAKAGEVLDLEMIMTLQNGSGADRTYTVRVKFGGTTHLAEALPPVPTGLAARPVLLRVRIQNDGTTSSQWITSTISVGLIGNDWTAAPLLPPATAMAGTSIDQTAAQTLAVSWQSDAATATQIVTTRVALLTLT